ncbi:Hypothetical predicted protein [Octopus vulgaris]|uniref:Uncharacterized protein n=1 Tax=Octopus vulgaris TaxID=6645 RepID=A0AA36B421_OCTVU|nr:Hypothetical predicted protein [Octopus vulgaris]
MVKITLVCGVHSHLLKYIHNDKLFSGANNKNTHYQNRWSSIWISLCITYVYVHFFICVSSKWVLSLCYPFVWGVFFWYFFNTEILLWLVDVPKKLGSIHDDDDGGDAPCLYIVIKYALS